MLHALAVAAGGAVGALSRYWLSELTYRALGTGFPYGTLAVNLLGSLLMGGLFVLVQRGLLGDDLRMLLAVGLLGAFTTFSTFSLDTLVLVEHGAWTRAVVNVVASVALCLAACALGMLLARRL